MIRGITLDLWDTIIADDSDEPKRRARGLPSKWDARVDVVEQAFVASGVGITRERITDACGIVAAAFRASWREQHRTFGVDERIDRILREVGVSLPLDVRSETIRVLEEMELDPAPDPVAGAVAGVAALASRWPLAIVSDTVMSPGRCLREIMRMHGLLDHFTACVFSDEAGRSKPHRDVFTKAAAALGTPLEDTVHIGDRELQDVLGAREAGMRSILFVGARDADLADTTADAVGHSWDELPSIISSL